MSNNSRGSVRTLASSDLRHRSDGPDPGSPKGRGGRPGFGQPLGGEGLVKGAMGWYLGGYLHGERVWRGTPAYIRYVTTVSTVETSFSRLSSPGTPRRS